MAYTSKGYARNWIGTYYLNSTQYGVVDGGATYSISDAGVETYIGASGTAWGNAQTDESYRYSSTGNTIYASYNTGLGVRLSLDCGYPVRALGIDKTNAKLYVALSNGVIYSTPTSAFSLTAFLSVGVTFGTSMAVIGNYLYYAQYGGQIHKVNLTTKVDTVLSKTISLPWLCLATDGTNLYATVDGGYIYWIDTNDVLQYKQILGDTTGRWWYGLNYNPATSSLWANAYTGLNYKIDIPAPSTAPVISPASGAISNTSLITITGSGDSIFYTLDGTTPTTASTPYTGPFTIALPKTIIAAEWVIGFRTPLAWASYSQRTCPSLTISTPAARFFSPTTCTITPSEVNAIDSIYYTIDGSTPTATSTLYTGAFTVSTSMTVKAICISSGCVSSAVVSLDFIADTIPKVNLVKVASFTSSAYPKGFAVVNGVSYVTNGITSIDTVDETTGISTVWLSIRGECLSEYNGYLVVGYTNTIKIYNVTTKALVKTHTLTSITSIRCLTSGMGGGYGVASDRMYRVSYDLTAKTETAIIGYPSGYKGGVSKYNSVFYFPSIDRTSFGCSDGSVYRYWINTSDITDNIALKIDGGGSVGTLVTNIPINISFVSGIYYYNSGVYLLIGSGANAGLYKIEMRNISSGQYIYSNGSWRYTLSEYVYTSGAWKSAQDVYEMKDGKWIQIF